MSAVASHELLHVTAPHGFEFEDDGAVVVGDVVEHDDVGVAQFKVVGYLSNKIPFHCLGK